MGRQSLLMLMIAAVVSGCAHQPDKRPTEALDALQPIPSSHPQAAKRPELPASAREDLRARARLGDTSRAQEVLAEPRFSVQANRISASEFFASLAEDSPYSIVVHPDVEGDISLSLKEVTIGEALSVVEDIYGYEIRRREQVIQVFPAGLRSETIALDYLSLRRFGLSQTSVSSGGVRDEERNNSPFNNNGLNSGTGNNFAQNQLLSPFGNQGQNSNNSMNRSQINGSQITSESETDMWRDLEEIIEGIIGEGAGRRVVVSPQAGLITINAYPAEIRAVKDFLGQAEERLLRQVILEARIIEVTLNDDFQQGVNWQNVLGGSSNLSYSLSGGLPSAGESAAGVFGITFDDGDFSGVVELLQQQGQVQVLSNPRVTAANNQKAVIKIGEDEYFVTDVSTTTFSGVEPISTPDVELTPFFSGISLDVTPQISADGDVTLHVHPSVVETSEQEKTINLGSGNEITLPLAQSNIRESDTIVRARNGEIVVLGGLMQTTYSDAESKAPLLGDIPLLGNLFKSRQRVEQKKELIILLRPVVVGEKTWQEELERSRDLLERWYPEGN